MARQPTVRELAQIVSDLALKSGPIYNDGTYKYFGTAVVVAGGPALTSPVWQVSRMNIATAEIQFVDGGEFSQVYTDQATVAALSFA